MSKLTSMIQEASQKYYSDGSSPLSDKEFDDLLGQLREEDPNSPLLETGHGYDVSQNSGKKVQHKYGVVGSLDKCHSWLEVSKALQEYFIQYHVVYSLKLDGLSVVLYYEEGKFVQAVTRGNGEVGIDITDKVSAIFQHQFGKIPEVDDELYFPGFTGAIRGEILMSDANFEVFQKEHPEAKNSRNSTAGLVNSKGVVGDLKYLNIIVYRIVGAESRLSTDYIGMLHGLVHNFGEENVVPFTYRHECHKTFDGDMFYLKTKWYNKWPADGIVITSNKLEQIDNEVIYNSIAYKYPSEIKESGVVDILWDLSKTGYLIPRIQIQPVEIAGSTVQFCTGIHAQAIKECGVGPGSRIKITKANEIIPQMLEVLNENPIELPSTCPECGTSLKWEGVHLKCPNRSCRNMQRQDVLCWFHALAPLDGLGDILILKYMEETFGADYTVESIYSHGILSGNTGLVQKDLFVKAFNQLHTKRISVEDAIRALNIPRFGDITATKCAKYSEAIKTSVQTGKLDERLISLGAANFTSLSKNPDKLARLNLIFDLIDWDSAPSADRGEVCITGKLSVPRRVFEVELKDAGFTVSGSVKKSTKYLITDDPNSGSSKNAAAIRYGVPKMTEQEFRKTILNA